MFGRLVGRLALRPRRVVARGLSAAGIAAPVGDHFADLGRRFVELARLDAALRAGLVRIDPEQVEVLRQAAAARGSLVLTAHFGHWELLGAALARAGLEVHSVAARAGSGPLHRWLAEIRAGAGLVVHPPGGGARAVLARLAEGRPVAVFFDLDTREKSRHLEFLGRPTRFSRTAERLLDASGASAFRAWTCLEADGHYRLDLQALGSSDPLAEAARHLETAVRLHPAQWVWLVDRWARAS